MKRIYDLKKEGFKNKDISVILNKEGYKTITGKAFNEANVHWQVRSRVSKSQPILSPVVFQQDNNIYTDSLNIAEYFNKVHADLLKTIESLKEGGKIPSNYLFIESTYTTENNRVSKKYLLNKDAFTLLTMGFTGKKALEFKLLYIQRFNEMEATLKQNNKPLPEMDLNQGSLKMFELILNSFKEQETKVFKAISEAKQEVKEEIKAELMQERQETLKSLENIEYSDRLPYEVSLRRKIHKILLAYSNYLGSQKLMPDLFYRLDTEIYDRIKFITRRELDKKRLTYSKATRYDVWEDAGILSDVYDIASFIFRVPD
jgi:Rha family phage regulatory protein